MLTFSFVVEILERKSKYLKERWEYINKFELLTQVDEEKVKLLNFFNKEKYRRYRNINNG